MLQLPKQQTIVCIYMQYTYYFQIQKSKSKTGNIHVYRLIHLIRAECDAKDMMIGMKQAAHTV